MKKMKKVSVLFPTRNRYEMFVKSISSLIENCNNVNNIEILLGVDYDDVETTEKISKFISDKNYIKLYYYERQRYRGLHHYINDLVKKTTDGSLMLWNDDAIMTSINWDTEILNLHDDNFIVINPKVINMEQYSRNDTILFPIIPKKWIEITESWSPTPGLDSWIDVLSKKLGITQSTGNISILHDRFDISGNNRDKTYDEGRADLQNPSLRRGYEVFSYPELLNTHYNKLLEHIKNNK